MRWFSAAALGEKKCTSFLKKEAKNFCLFGSGLSG
jgi:hypothetical protein